MHPYRYRITALVVAILPCAELPAEEKDWDYWGVELVRGYTSDAKQPLLDFLNDWHADRNLFPRNCSRGNRHLNRPSMIYTVRFSDLTKDTTRPLNSL